MCGICGFIGDGNGTAEERLMVLKAMCGSLRHRGPDDEGLMVRGRAALGMQRLSIIDLQTGHQPIHNEDKTIWVVLNGEIYNYRELRHQLVAKGHTFSTESDTEVIVHLYEDHGADCVRFLRGMFAFAVWDCHAEILLLARDRLGEKPLYYYLHGDGVVFGSELKALLWHPSVPRDLDLSAMVEYLRFNYVPEPLSIFRNIHKLPAGCLLVLERGRARVESYWDLPRSEPQHRSEEDLSEELLDRLNEAVRVQLVSDVPLGAFLSGGVDSSTIVALMTKLSNRPVRTFSIGFDEPQYDELHYARTVARHLGTEHHEEVVGPASVCLLDEIICHFDEPFGDPSSIPTYHVAKLAGRHVKVVLTGDGGDEIFAGYERYSAMMRRRWLQRVRHVLSPTALRTLSAALPLNTPGKRWLANLSLPPDEQYLDSITYLSHEERLSVLSAEVMEQAARTDGQVERGFMDRWLRSPESADFVSRLLYFDTKTYLPGDILTKVDRMTMANSLESRAPFLDHKLVEFMASLPSELKLHGDRSKYLLKLAARRLLPKEILERPKQGFSAPFSYWFREDMKTYLREVLMDRRVTERGLYRAGAIERMLAEWEAGRQRHGVRLWLLLVLELWCRRYLDELDTVPTRHDASPAIVLCR